MPRLQCFAPVLCAVAVLCLSAFLPFLLSNGLQIPGGDVYSASLPAEEVDGLRSVYLPLFPLSLSREERDEWVEVVSMTYDERVEMCRQMDDPEFVSLYDTMLARARSERLDDAVVEQLKVDLAAYFDLDECTGDDLGFFGRLGMLNVLVPPQRWTRMEEAVSAAVARAGSTLIKFPARVGWGVGGIFGREITAGRELGRGPTLGNTTKEEDINIGVMLDVGKRSWSSTGQDEVCTTAREQKPQIDISARGLIQKNGQNLFRDGAGLCYGIELFAVIAAFFVNKVQSRLQSFVSRSAVSSVQYCKRKSRRRRGPIHDLALTLFACLLPTLSCLHLVSVQCILSYVWFPEFSIPRGLFTHYFHLSSWMRLPSDHGKTLQRSLRVGQLIDRSINQPCHCPFASSPAVKTLQHHNSCITTSVCSGRRSKPRPSW